MHLLTKVEVPYTDVNFWLLGNQSLSRCQDCLLISSSLPAFIWSHQLHTLLQLK